VQLDGVTLALALAGVAMAVGVAIVVGTLTARLFFHASRRQVETATDRHEVVP
jgi:hypothetical protein